MKGKNCLLAAAFLSVVALFGAQAPAAEYPTRSIEILCPFTPGASMDMLARLIAEIAPKYTGQPWLVVNKPGAGGSLAVAELLASKPDGYKLVTVTNLFFATTTKTQKIPFDPNDVVPIASFQELRNGLMVRGDASWKTLNDLIDYAKKNPGTLKWAHSGRGLSLHLGVVAILNKTGAQMIEVPYKGSPEVLAALLGGHVDVASVPYGTVAEQVKAGKGRFLVFYIDKRYPDLPNVPCATELGYPDAGKLGTFTGLFLHKNTPENIKNYLVDVSKKIYDDPRFKKGVEAYGELPRYGTAEFMKTAIREGEEVGVPILKQTGIYVGR